MSKDASRAAVCGRVIRLIREERERLGVSMNVLAHRAGLSQSTISRIEHELRIPNIDTLLRMCEVLELDLGKVIQQAIAETRESRRR